MHIKQSNQTQQPIVVEGLSFALNGNGVSYRFHVDKASGDLISTHYGGSVSEDPMACSGTGNNWSTQDTLRREFPELGRGDFRVPAVHIRHAEGHTVTHFKYRSHEVANGKPKLRGLPCTFGTDDEVQTLIVHMYDEINSVSADLSYSIFPQHDAVIRSVKVTNQGSKEITVEKLASFSLDLPRLPYANYDMVGLHGDWARERQRTRMRVRPGVQSSGSSQGFASHVNNPFIALCPSDATESHGDVWALAMVYSGSHNAEVELASRGGLRALIGMNALQLAWPLAPGESLTSPECISVYSGKGFGDMSRKQHRLIRHNLMRSKYTHQVRSTLLNDWEGVYFDFDEKAIYEMAKQSAKLGAKLFVMDDGWFGGDKYPRINDRAGLGDWDPNPDRFPDGLACMVHKLKKDLNIQFGIWFEPEMVNPKSKLFEAHPDWAMQAPGHPITAARHQYILNLGLPEVQDYIIDFMSKTLSTVAIDYVKWDHNRGIFETPSPSAYHKYMLGLYRVFQTLTQKFPDVLWEGCSAGGARFDLGIMHYFPQIWTSDNTDAWDRIHIQLGTSLAYPASAMGAHVSASPNDMTHRSMPLQFRAHVAMMGGSFGLELDPRSLSDEDRSALPNMIAQAEYVSPVIIRGDMYRLSLPEDSNYPAVLFVSEDGDEAVLFLFQIKKVMLQDWPVIRLQGLDARAKYRLDGGETYSALTLMNGGVSQSFKCDFDSKVMVFHRV